MSSNWIYSRCPNCGHNNVHVVGNRLAVHYDGRVKCLGSGHIAEEARVLPLPASVPRVKGSRNGKGGGA